MRRTLVLLPLLIPFICSCGRQASVDSQPPAVSRQARDVAFDVEYAFASLKQAHGPADESQVADQLEALGAEAIPLIEPHLNTDDAREQLVALVALQRLQWHRSQNSLSHEALMRYLNWLSDANVAVRTYAMESLIRAGEASHPLLTTFRSQASSDVQARLDIVLREIAASSPR